MNKSQLTARLDHAGILPESYSLDGGLPSERYVLSQEPMGKWTTYYSERGKKQGLRFHDSEAEACQFFLEQLLREPSVYSPINSPSDVYRFVRLLRSEAKRQGHFGLDAQLDDALNLSSSGLEILGALGKTLRDNRSLVEQLLGSFGKVKTDHIVAFVDRAYRG